MFASLTASGSECPIISGIETSHQYTLAHIRTSEAERRRFAADTLSTRQLTPGQELQAVTITPEQPEYEPTQVVIDGECTQLLVATSSVACLRKSIGNTTLYLGKASVASLSGSTHLLHHGEFVIQSNGAPARCATPNYVFLLPPHSSAVASVKDGKLRAIQVLTGTVLLSPDGKRSVSLRARQCAFSWNDSLQLASVSSGSIASVTASVFENGGLVEASKRASSPAIIHAAKGSNIKLDDRGHSSLVYGWFLLAAPKESKVNVGTSEVLFNKTSIVNAEVDEEAELIGACTGNNAVHVRTGKQHINLSAGEEFLRCAFRPDNPSLLHGADGISRKGFSCFKTDESSYAVHSFFNASSLLLRAEHTEPMRRPKTKIDESIRESILKSSVAASIATAGRGPYKLCTANDY